MKVTIDTNNKISKQTVIVIVVSIIITLLLILGFGYKRYYVDYYESVFSGLVRGNRKTRIYHIPKCPNYDRMNFKTVKEFQTIEEAEKAKYRPAVNCPSGIVEARRKFETK